MMPPDRHDVIVVGGGVAGVNCALECFDIQLDVVLFEAKPALGGQLPEILHSVRNVAAGRFEDGSALQAKLADASSIVGDRARRSHAVSALDVTEKWVEVGGERHAARALVLATGTARRELAAAPDGAFDGAITYELETNPRRFAGAETVAVIGGGDSAALDALAIARDGSSVVLVHRRGALTARRDVVDQVRVEARIEDLAGWELDEVQGNDRLEAVALVHRGSGQRRSVAVEGLVVQVGRIPNTRLLQGQLELDAAGAVLVDRDLATSAPGVFAAGDVVSASYWRVAAALGQGSLAARSVLRYLEGRS
jgi:thioredoxin reductase (NADPH)